MRQYLKRQVRCCIDIVGNMSSSRFIPLIADFKNKSSMLLIADYKFYNENEKEIVSWSKEFLKSFSQQGMILEFNNDEDRLIFIMRWS